MQHPTNDDGPGLGDKVSPGLLSTSRRGFLGVGVGVATIALPALAAAAADEPAPELARIKSLLAAPEPITWVFTGDSITHGALHTYGRRSYTELFAERVRYEMHRPRDMVINTGISGDSTAGLLADLPHRVLRFGPQVFSIMMGMNDAGAGASGRDEFRSRYDQILARVRAETKAALVVHTCNPITAAATSRQDLPAYVEIIRELAAKHGAVLVDHDAHWRRRKTQLNLLLNDGTIHPNEYGHVLFALLTLETLDMNDPQSNTGRFFVPA